MWLFSSLVFLANPLIGGVLLLSAAFTTAMRVATVDRELAKQGKPPASYGLVDRWLENRKAKGQAPATAKVAKPGMWRYAWQRWQAMWEDLGDQHREVRDQYKQAKADAKANGQKPPKKPTFKETLTGWKWHLDQRAPAAEPQASEKDDQATKPAGESPKPGPATAQTAPAPAGNPVNAAKPPAARPTPQPSPSAPQPTPPQPANGAGRCGRCGGPTSRLKKDTFTVCPACDGIHKRAPERSHCMACSGWGYQVSVAPQMSDYDRDQRLHSNKPVAWKVFIHELTGTNQCPTDDQLDQIDALREEDKPGPDARMQHWLNPANRRAAPVRAGTMPGPQPKATLSNPFAYSWPCPDCGAEQKSADQAQSGTACSGCRARKAKANEQVTAEGESMTQQQSGEVTGIPSAIGYLERVADVHRAHASEAELLTAAMANMRIGDGDIGLVRAAAAQSVNAADLHAAAAESLRRNNAAVREAFASAPEAADKQAQMAE